MAYVILYITATEDTCTTYKFPIEIFEWIYANLLLRLALKE